MKVLYLPTENDYIYFMGFYGYGGVFENPKLVATTIERFMDACDSCQRKVEPWDEFASIEREIMRDYIIENK